MDQKVHNVDQFSRTNAMSEEKKTVFAIQQYEIS